jgi:hypothetical protein
LPFPSRTRSSIILDQQPERRKRELGRSWAGRAFASSELTTAPPMADGWNKQTKRALCFSRPPVLLDFYAKASRTVAPAPHLSETSLVHGHFPPRSSQRFGPTAGCRASPARVLHPRVHQPGARPRSASRSPAARATTSGSRQAPVPWPITAREPCRAPRWRGAATRLADGTSWVESG